MNKKPANPELDKLRSAYANAVLTFNAASTAMILNLAADKAPTDELIAAEEESRAAVVAARRVLWAAYAKA